MTHVRVILISAVIAFATVAISNRVAVLRKGLGT
jgi:hypothetical protein